MATELTSDEKRLLAIMRKQLYMVNGAAGREALWFRYGMTRDDVVGLLVKQNGRCDDCGCDLQSVQWCIDHSHETGKNRGILCYSCNTAIRSVDKMLKHVAYLRKHGEKI